MIPVNDPLGDHPGMIRAMTMIVATLSLVLCASAALGKGVPVRGKGDPPLAGRRPRP